MELWLDTIDFNVIEDANKLGILAGVTTNPAILGKVNAAPEAIIKKLLDIQDGWVAVQTTETELSAIMRQAQRLAKLSAKIIIKIPAVNDGFHAISALEKQGVRTLATVIFETRQIILAGMLGVSYAAPYLNRIEAVTQNAYAVIGDGNEIIRRNQYKTKIMAASIRIPEQFVQCAKIGISAATISSELYRELFSSNVHIDDSLEKFKNLWASNDFTDKSALFHDI
jgi:TalC/MipB family fructose-6-phosphate aldolase